MSDLYCAACDNGTGFPFFSTTVSHCCFLTTEWGTGGNFQCHCSVLSSCSFDIQRFKSPVLTVTYWEQGVGHTALRMGGISTLRLLRPAIFLFLAVTIFHLLLAEVGSFPRKLNLCSVDCVIY